MRLSELQKHFIHALYGGEAVELQPYIANNGIAIEARLAIYRNTLSLNLSNALKAAYPVIFRLVGEEFFHFLAGHYSKTHKSLSGNMEEYGANMALFLTSFPPVSTLPYLQDVARLEWACHLAYHAEDEGKICIEQFINLSPERYGDVRFQFHPSCHLLASNYPLYTIWQVNQSGYEGESAVERGAAGCYILVMRDAADVVRLVVLGKAEYCFLTHLEAGGTLYEAYEEAEKSEISFNLSESIRKNVADNVFVAYDA